MEAVDIFNQKYGLADKKLLLAVSGGVDSMSLLFVYQKFNIAVAHFNHNLRIESAKEEVYLKNWCQNKNIPFYSKRAVRPPKSEEEARNMRYTFLYKIKRQEQADYILTAHQLNDQVETLIFKLVRGSGPLDLWGMKESEGCLLRPLLSVPKDVLVNFAQTNKIKYFEDKSNKDIKFSRNRIRLNVIPELERINPSVLNQIYSTAELGQGSAQFLKDLIEKESLRVVTNDEIDICKFKEISSEYLKGEILKKYLKEQAGVRDIYQKNVAQLRKIIESTGNKQTSLAGVTFTKTYQKLSKTTAQIKNRPKEMPLTDGLNFSNFQFHYQKNNAPSGKNNIYLPRRLAYNLYVKTLTVGDRIKTRSGTKKLQDLFSDAKVERGRRANWPIVTNGDEIIWVPLLAKHHAHKNQRSNETINIEVIDETSE